VTDAEIGFPQSTSNERNLLLHWLRYLRRAVMRKAEGVSEAGARWRPDGRLISLIGIVTHLTNVEWRWVEGGMLGEQVSRAEEEFEPDPGRSIEAALHAYRDRQTKTDATVGAVP
jgi:hypothetical protein